MPFKIAISGMNAATVGLRTTANNIANVNTAGFKQSRAEFTERIPTGVAADVALDGESVGSSQSGAPEASNVDLTEQLLNMIKFSTQLKAQAKVIRTASENAETITSLVGARDSK